MKGKRNLVVIALVVAVLGGDGCAVRPMKDYERDPTLPQVDGALQVPGLQGEVKVYRDRHGVPHVMTDNEHDLFFADGYVQAQDRLWEMMFFRAIATGRLCEIFGDIGVPGQAVMGMKLTTFEMDKRMRIMGMRYLGELGEALLAETQPEALARLQAFCDGVNAFLEQNRDRLPVEFQVLYYQPEPFRPADIISLSRFYGSNLGGNLDDELARFALIQKYGEDMAWKLMPLHDTLGPTIVPTDMLQNRLPAPKPLPPGGRPEGAAADLSGDAALRLAVFDQAARAASLYPKDTASNNWVVGPQVTATGTAMLANDPHLIHVEPSLCYVMHLSGAGRDAYGCVFPGQPFVVMGHTRRMAWGATVTGADVQDLFIETADPDHPGQYLYKGQWRDYTEREEVIKIRPGTVQTGPDRRLREKTITVRHTVHGPVINDMVPNFEKDAPPLAFRWAGWDFSRDPRMFELFIEAATVDDFRAKLKSINTGNLQTINESAMFDLWAQGEGVDDFVKGMEYNGLLNMNWVCADADGRIAYLPGSLVPIRGKGIGAVPAPGESGEYDWTGFIPLAELPQAIDPERGWMATANNQVVDAQWYPYTFATNYDGGWRAWRIEELIEQLKPITVDDMKRIQNDVYVKQADVFVPLILAAVEKKGAPNDRVREAAKILRDWDRQATIDAVGASIYFETMDMLPDRVLKDEFKGKDYNKLVKGHIAHTVQMWVARGNEEFMDDQRTRGQVEDIDDALVGALEDAVASLSRGWGRDMREWQWGRLHTIKWYHPMGFGPLADMSIGPFPEPGGDTTVRNASSFGLPGKRKYMALGGPVMRHVIDMGDPDHGQLVIDGSESGQWRSPHYSDMHSLFYNSQYMTAEKRPEQIKEQAESTLTLTPQP